jgi:hypothetical protein
VVAHPAVDAAENLSQSRADDRVGENAKKIARTLAPSMMNATPTSFT